jgi:hypothetical protein
VFKVGDRVIVINNKRTPWGDFPYKIGDRVIIKAVGITGDVIIDETQNWYALTRFKQIKSVINSPGEEVKYK